MGLASDMKNLTEELLASFKQRIAENEKLVSDVRTTLDGFRKDHQEMTNILIANAAQGRSERIQNEKNRMKEFDALMKNINDNIKSINNEVASIFKNTNDMLDRFEKEHQDMSDELRTELSENLAERVEYTRTLLNGFQKRLSEISKENHKMAQNLRKDLANGETERLSNYNGIMKNIHVSIRGIRTDVKNIKKYTGGMLDDFLQNRVEASAEWKKMQDAMDQIRKTGVVMSPEKAAKKSEKKR